jgi:hypothetical protein
MNCTPLPVGTNHVAGHDVLHMAPLNCDMVSSSSAPPAEGADRSSLGASGTHTPASLAATLAAPTSPVATLAVPTGASDAPSSSQRSSGVERPSPAMGAGCSHLVSVGCSSPGTPGTPAPSLATVGARPTGAPAPSTIVTHRTSTSSAKVVIIPPVENAHTMRTRGKTGLHVLPSPRLNLQPSTLSPLPKMYRSALADPN